MNASKFTNQAARQAHGRFLRSSEQPGGGSLTSRSAALQFSKKMISLARKFGKEFLLFCGLGGVCGAAIGFFMYLHLGPFKNPEDAGYAAGLFVKSGVMLGCTVWMIRAAILALRRVVFGSPKKMS